MGHRHGNLNSKGEWGACNIPRLTIEKEEFAKMKDEFESRIKREKEEQELKDFIHSKKPTETKGGEEPLPEVRKRKRPECVITLELEQGSPARRNEIDSNEVAPDGWRALEVASGGKDVTTPTDDQAGQQEETEHDRVAPASVYSADVGTVGGGKDSTTKNDRGIVVRGGKKGKGQSLFTVRNIADHFKVIASVANVHDPKITPKRKQENVDLVDSPATKRRKLKFEEE